jgi:hypothetical protein
VCLACSSSLASEEGSITQHCPINSNTNDKMPRLLQLVVF